MLGAGALVCSFVIVFVVVWCVVVVMLPLLLPADVVVLTCYSIRSSRHTKPGMLSEANWRVRICCSGCSAAPFVSLSASDSLLSFVSSCTLSIGCFGYSSVDVTCHMSISPCLCQSKPTSQTPLSTNVK